jgi:hypothetical protein
MKLEPASSVLLLARVAKSPRRGQYRVLTGVTVAFGIFMMVVFLEGIGFVTWAAVEAIRDPNSPRQSRVLKVFAVAVFVTYCAYGVVAAVWPEMRCCG